MKAIPISHKAGFLVFDGTVLCYRYSEETGQLLVTNTDGASLFKPLSGDAAKEALAEIQAKVSL